MIVSRLAVPYLRVSTDDKGQDPGRQMLSIEPWASREGLALLKPAVDNGTSASKVPALKRPVFLEACERAKAAGAEAIIMEVPDRFSRQSPDVAVWEQVEVERRYGLKLYFTCMTLEMQASPMGKVFIFMQQTTGYIWVEDHRKKVLSGNVRARARGQRLGRKPKEIAVEEVALIDGWRSEGLGWETVANRLTFHRVGQGLTDKKVQRERTISASALKRWDKVRRAEPSESPEISPAEMQVSERGALA
jgi:DNA invertase Pin-like site-specific DNA recombinase